MDGLLEDVLTVLNQALDLSRHNNNQAGEGLALNNIFQIYQARGDFDTAFDYLKRSLDIQQAIGDQAGLRPVFDCTRILFTRLCANRIQATPAHLGYARLAR